MRKVLLAGSAALSLLVVPAAIHAQSDPAAPATSEMPAAPPSAPAPAMQPPAASSASAPTLTPEQQATYDSWTPAQKSDYESWPNDYKVYYWTLSMDQQKGYWALTADQRGQIYKMTPEQRQMAWNSVLQQLKGETPATPPGQANPPGPGVPTEGVPDPQAANQAARPAMPADETYQGGPYKGALTPPPATAMDKTYPVCSKTVTDACRNRGGK
ncbi:hypothetical protein [Novosphingobium sp. fls2-241-R2A-195]|uniref:hypothetical protein n=1 Tax=Novosphingobium sp. fls2-241-R2A-195 TaxID=3040296 RepID=UPI0025501A9C|nr:hypothetical protein [Novosphingobium sp. fls2-241-R2A-195]